MKCDPGQIVLIPFPYSDLSTAKRRPVLVLTPADSRGDFIGLAVTSVPGHQHAISIAPSSLPDAKLPKPSWVRIDKIFTLESALVSKVFGAVAPAFLAQVLSDLCHRVGHQG